MTSTTLFYILIGIIIINFIIDKVLSSLNAKHFNDALPSELQDVYDENEYKKSQAYKATNQRFSNITSAFSLLLTLSFFYLDGFEYVDTVLKHVEACKKTYRVLLNHIKHFEKQYEHISRTL